MKKKINFKKIYYYYLIGNSILKKQKCKNLIKKKIKLIIKKIDIIYIYIYLNTNWNSITKEIINKNIILKKKLLIINFIEKIKKINKKIKNYIFKYIHNKKNKNIFIIFNFEYINNKKIYLNNIKKSLIINCNNNNKNKNILELKYKKNKNINNWIKSIKKKNIKKNIYFFNTLKNNNINMLYILNIIFNIIIKEKNLYKIKKKIKILEMIQKYETNIKKNINISWHELELISIYIIK